MPIRIPDHLPAASILEQENIFVMKTDRAYCQDIRPLHILILNLMPTKIATETQLLRLLSNSPLQIEVDFMTTASYRAKNTPVEHMERFYEVFADVKDRYYDGMIITGAPVEKLPYEEVSYWREICKIMDWSQNHVYSTMYICWGAQAALYYHYGIPKYNLARKMFGIFPHHKSSGRSSSLLRGFDDEFFVPHSRYTEVRQEDVSKVNDLRILASSDISGIYAIEDKEERKVFLTGHVEYDRTTLNTEYWRDIHKDIKIKVPYNYYAEDNAQNTPIMSWRSSAYLLFSNWLNYYVYQKTPYEIENIEQISYSHIKGKEKK